MISKIGDEFHHYKQAQIDELIEEYLLDLSLENNIKPDELLEKYGFRCLRYMIHRFKTEVEKIWRENENKN